jgi:ADP-ribose pyrophosphatase YjhB (NUDIX family)
MHTPNRIRELVTELDGLFPDSRQGLPLELFYFVSRLTPLVNVDLLIRNDRGEILLTWREDQFYKGWHIPGGIIRFKETAAERIKAVGMSELGAAVEADPAPCEVHEKQNCQRDVRGHFISLLYTTRLISDLDHSRVCTDLAHPRNGQWAWHGPCPELLLPNHASYRHLFQS